MYSSKNICRAALICEFVAVYSLPSFFLLLGTLLVVPQIVASYHNPTAHDGLIIMVLLGGYLGMTGVIKQLLFVLNIRVRNLGWASFVFTLFGCLAISPYSLMAVQSGKVIVIIAGLAPILVAVQLTFMNWVQLQNLFKQK